jgi:hypothetical protein
LRNEHQLRTRQSQYAWIAVGCEWQHKLSARIVHKSMLAWSGKRSRPNIDEVMRALGEGFKEYMEENECEKQKWSVTRRVVCPISSWVIACPVPRSPRCTTASGPSSTAARVPPPG